jgi:hypothetical protein
MSLQQTLKRFPRDAGVLRMLLFGYTLVALLAVPSPGTTPIEHGWRMITTLLIPLSIPFLWISLLVDAFMARLLMLEHKPGDTQRARLRRLAWTNLLLAALIVVVWVRYFRAIH